MPFAVYQLTAIFNCFRSISICKDTAEVPTSEKSGAQTVRMKTQTACSVGTSYQGKQSEVT